MAAEPRVEERRRVGRRLPIREARSPALELFVWSRAAIWAAALLAFLWFEPNRHPLAGRWDNPQFHDLGWALDVWARWDSGWFLRIAEDGYSEIHPGTAVFHPLYPAVVAVLGRAFLGHYVLAGVAVSLAACLAAFLLLYRLAETKLGADGARRAVLYLAVFPTTLFLQAVYSESLYLVLVLAAFLFAERGRFVPAGAVAGLALLTRASGVALLPALALLAWRARERRRAFGGLLVAPAMFAVLPLTLAHAVGDPWAFARNQERWDRELSPLGPLGGIWDGTRAAWDGLVVVSTRVGASAYTLDGHTPRHVAAENIEALAFLVLFAFLTVVVWRRFGAAYGLFAALSVALPLSVPSDPVPLLSLPRFGLPVFPFFLALAALAGGRPRTHAAILSISALLLGVTVVRWSLWQWVA